MYSLKDNECNTCTTYILCVNNVVFGHPLIGKMDLLNSRKRIWTNSVSFILTFIIGCEARTVSLSVSSKGRRNERNPAYNFRLKSIKAKLSHRDQSNELQIIIVIVEIWAQKTPQSHPINFQSWVFTFSRFCRCRRLRQLCFIDAGGAWAILRACHH